MSVFCTLKVLVSCIKRAVNTRLTASSLGRQARHLIARRAAHAIQNGSLDTFKLEMTGSAKRPVGLGLREVIRSRPPQHRLLYRYRSEEHTSELQSHSFISYAVF